MPAKSLTPTQKAYIAGFLDADGSISIAGGITRWGHQHWALQVYFYNCNLEVLKKIKGWMGIGSIRQRKRSDTWRISYTLKFQGPSAARLLCLIQKYLIIKNKQAKIALRFAQTFAPIDYIGSSWRTGRRLKPKTIQKRIKLKSELQSLTLTANYLGKYVN